MGALREHAERLGADGRLRVDVEAPPDVDRLPAAVEVAAYRIALEAITNVARHTDARTCLVRVAVDGDLQVEIVDDGAGLSPSYRPGVGVASMRERAAELGGTCEIEAGDGGGMRVRARLPLGPR